jgi:nitrate/TMAO reductase-like tetraheme cytochrome c subunit
MCHPDHDTNFVTGHETNTHDDAGHSKLIATGAAQCTDCHEASAIISVVHNDDCEICHTDTTPTGTDGTFVALSSALNHTIGQDSKCIDCHTDIRDDFTAHSIDTHATALAIYTNSVPSQDCSTNCHTAADGEVIRDTIHDKTYALGYGNTCENCHTNITDDGRLTNNIHGKANLASVDKVIDGAARTPSTCDTCHSAATFFSSHDYAGAHLNVSYSPDPGPDMSQNPLEGCAVTCHDPNNNDLAGWVDIRAEHNNDCLSCHDYDGSTIPEGYTPAVDVQNAIYGSGGTCATCHTDKLDGAANVEHGTHSASHFTAPALCTDCHNGGNNVVDIIHGGCALCHVSSSGGGAVHGSATGQISSGQPWDCTDCHSPITNQAEKVAFHHATDAALLGRCDTCHGDGTDIVNTSIAPRQLNCVRCHYEDTGTVVQIRAFDLSVLSGATPVDPHTGPVDPTNTNDATTFTTSHVFDYTAAGTSTFNIRALSVTPARMPTTRPLRLLSRSTVILVTGRRVICIRVPVRCQVLMVTPMEWLM